MLPPPSTVSWRHNYCFHGASTVTVVVSGLADRHSRGGVEAVEVKSAILF